jgi:spore maturation protein CgeB
MEMTVLQRNREVLAECFPDLAQRLESVPGGSQDINVFASRKGTMTCRVRRSDGRWVTLHSTIDPEKESAPILKRLESTHGGIAVFVGVGLGYPLLALTKGHETERQTIVVVESHLSLFKVALELFDWTSVLKGKNLHLFIGEAMEKVLNDIVRIRMRADFQNLVVIPHPPSIRGDPHYYQPLLNQLRLVAASPLRSRIDYPRLARDHLTVLVLDGNYFLIRECVKTLKALGHRVLRVPISDQVVETILRHVVQDRPDFLLSVNHLGFDEAGKLTELLEALRLPFAVWYVDSPTFIIENFKRNVSPYCVLFIWDQSYLESMKACGFQRAYFLPLATDPSVFRPIARNRVPPSYRGEISFVGNSMVETVKDWAARFPNSPTTDTICRLAVPLQMANHRLPVDQILDTIAKNHGLRAEFKDPVHHRNFQAALVWEATLAYRKSVMQSLEEFGVRIFGDAGWHQLLEGKAEVFPPVNYYRELPLVYNGCAVNINATSFQMNSAVNQRVFDTGACGAFLVTDRQPDMDRLFDREQESVCYEDVAQARDQVAYYLRHKKDRQRIADRARRRVLGEHTYEHRLKRIIGIMREEF